ncbi:MAG TPA: tetratricopeptide repeat protein [Pirellulales bacterium]|jgi:CHAT domain-containing protein|nr:tetratricopeptide repeat protein [Pirellulales bacterium]
MFDPLLRPRPRLISALALCCVLPLLALHPVAAQQASQPPAQPQGPTPPANNSTAPQSPAGEKPQTKYTSQQQQQLDRANSLLNQVSKLNDQGKYVDAIPLAAEAIKLRKAALGPIDDHLIANGAAWLGFVQQHAGKYAEALANFQQALTIDEKALGSDDCEVATDLNNLAGLYQDQGNYAEALPLYQRSLKIREKALGPDHTDVSQSLNNLAGLYQDQGNYADALPLFQRAIKIDEKALGPDHLFVATDVNNLALVYQDLGNYAEALPLFQRALKIYEKAFGPDHPDVAQILNNLAGLYTYQENYAEALPLYQRALKIGEKSLGPEHPGLATKLNSLAMLYHTQGSYSEALPLYQRALKIRETALGPDHPDVAQSLNLMAFLYDARGQGAQAEPLSHRALTILRGQLERTAVIQSERQQLQMAELVRYALDEYLTISHDAETPAEQAYAEVLAWKGSVSARQQAMRQLRASSHDPKVAALYAQLADTARQLDSLSRATPKPDQADDYKHNLAELNEKLETLQQQLAATSADYRRQLAEQKLTPADLQRVLPTGSVLVDFLEYWNSQPPKKKEQNTTGEQWLAAFVVRRDQPIQWIELGPSKPIAELVDHWRESYSAEDGAQLRKLVWQPLEEKLSDAKTVLVSPDGALDRFPLAALPGKKEGTYLIEDVAIATVPIPRLLPELLALNSPSPRPSPATASLRPARGEGAEKSPSLLTVGEVDFKAALTPLPQAEQLVLRAPQNQNGHWRFDPLPGTRAEIVAINDSFEQRFPDAQHKSLRKDQATKQAVCEAMPHYAYLHLATHGFFTPPGYRSALVDESGKEKTAGAEMRSAALDVAGYHPDVLSGLALAGANQQAEPGQDDGILTALAVEELDLSHVQLATLSACQTGLGQTAGGEGVLGLQRAFQLAGARSTVATLWKIPDKASQLLMTDFYENLWDSGKHFSRLEALRQSQLKMLREGANRGIELPDDNTASSNNTGSSKPTHDGRMPPFYWAAFELSGDWR